MCRNNTPVQLSLLEHGHMPQLIQLFLDYTPGNECGNDGDDALREKAVQALSASARGHDMAEHIFCQNELGKAVLQLGLGMQNTTQPKPAAPLRRRSLFLLRALLTADEATDERRAQFRDVISFVCTHGIDELWEEEAEIREMGLTMLTQLLPHPLIATAILAHKSRIGAVGVGRIAAIRGLTEGSEERD